MWEDVYYLDMTHTWYSKVCYMKHTSFHSHVFILAPALGKSCPYSEFFWSYFPAFGLNTKKYVYLRICPNAGKYGPEKL